MLNDLRTLIEKHALDTDCESFFLAKATEQFLYTLVTTIEANKNWQEACRPNTSNSL